MSREITDGCQLLQEFWPKLKAKYQEKFPDRELFLTTVYRSPAEQLDLYEQNRPGMIFTRCDGYKNLSKHNYNPSKAFDVAVREFGKSLEGLKTSRVVWDEKYYIPLSSMIKDIGYSGKIRWGGWWSFRDYQHFEVM